ncbi:helix-turn-helix domain-containing protein [Microbacterium gilvum]|uniref:HTH cro/C1-type domain-containing protein n=1 Tax=Microbacterium gilvum TaxID=1336204 RepID=A0ABP9AA06_9MICO
MPRVPSPAAAYVGQRIAAIRVRQTMTQDQLAVRSDIDSSNIRSYESGRSMMNVQSLVRIATALGVEPGELVDGLTPEMFATPSSDKRRKAG